MCEGLKQSDLEDIKPAPGAGKGFGYGCLVNLAVTIIVILGVSIFPDGFIFYFLINTVMIILAWRKNQTAFAQGLMIAAAIPLLLFGSCWYIVTH